MRIIHRWGRLFTAPPTGTVVKGTRFKKESQSNGVGAGAINPNTADPNSVAYDPAESLTQGALSRISPSLTRVFTWVHIWNNSGQVWQPYSVLQNAQGFDGTEGSGNPTYVPGFCSFLGLAQWWEANRPGEHLFLEKAGAVGQQLGYFQKDAGNGVYQAIANRTWIPANAAYPAYAASLGVTQTIDAGAEWLQGETEMDIANYAVNLDKHISNLIADGYWLTQPSSKLVVGPSVNQQTPDTAAGMVALAAQKATFIAQHSYAVGYSPARITVYKDMVHWDALTHYRTGNEDIPEALGWAPATEKFFFRGFASTGGNTATTWYDESTSLNHLVALPGAETLLVTDSVTSKKAYTPKLSGHSKMQTATGGGFQALNGTAKTLLFAVQQPITTNAPFYLFENKEYALSPGYSGGPVSTLQTYIGGPQNTAKTTILALEIGPDSNGDGKLTIYNGTTPQATGASSLSRIDGYTKASYFSTVEPQYANLDAQQGTFWSAYIAYPGISSTRLSASVMEITARAPAGTTFTPAAAPPPAGSTQTDQEPTGAYLPLVFSPTATGIYLNDLGDWYRSSSLPPGKATGLASSYLATNMSGRVLLKYGDAGSNTAAIGFHTQPRRVNLGQMAYGLYINQDGNLAAINNGTPLNQTYPATLGHYYAITRIGNSGVVRVEESADGTNWTPLFTYTTTTKAVLYVTMDLSGSSSQLQQPQGQSLASLNIPAPNGNLVLVDEPGNQYAGGFLQVPNNLLTLAQGAYWFYWVPDTTTTPQYELPLCVGKSGANTEAFSLTRDGGSITARVRSSNGAFVFTDPLPMPPAGALIGVNLDSTSIQLYVDGTPASTSPKPTGFAPAATTAPLTLGAGFDSGLPQLTAFGAYSCLGISTRLFTNDEWMQLSAAKGQLSTLNGTAHFFALTNLLTSSTLVSDSADASKSAAVYTGNY